MPSETNSERTELSSSPLLQHGESGDAGRTPDASDDLTALAAGSGAGLAMAGDGAQEGEIRTYRARWLVLALFCMSTAMNAVLWITFSPINTLTQSYYGISGAQVNALSIVFLAAYVPVSLVTGWVFSRYGPRRGMLIACVLNVLSGLLRFLSTESNSAPRGDNAYAILMAGQLLGAIAQPFLTNLPALIGALWFPAEQRDIATVIASLFNPVGIAIGSVLPTFFADTAADTVQMFDLLLVELVLTAVVLVAVALLFRDRPPLPPSLSESARGVGEKPSVKEQALTLLKNRHYNLLLLCFGMGLGFFNALTTLVEQIVAKSGYTVDDAGLFSGLLIGCGILSAIAVGLLLDRTHRYRTVLKVCFGLAGILVVAFVLVLRPNQTAALMVVFAGMGATMLPLLPVTFECAAECTYPLSEDLSTAGLMSAGQITGIVFIVVLGALLDNQPDYGDGYVFEPTYIVIVASTLVFCLAAQLYNGPYLRLQADGGSPTAPESMAP